MIGFKQVDQLNLEECFDILVKNEEHPLFEEVKMRFIAMIPGLSIEESYIFLERRRDDIKNVFYQMVDEKYDQLVEKDRAQEERDFKVCQTIWDYEIFIGKYESKAPAYKAIRIEDARTKILELQEENDYKAENKIRRKKRILWIVLALFVVGAAVVFFVGYKPVKIFEIEDVEFGKAGGTKEIQITTNVSSSAIEVKLPEVNWLDAQWRGKNISLLAITNNSSERSCTIDVVAYASFFGRTIYSRKITKTVVVSQESSYASNMQSEEETVSIVDEEYAAIADVVEKNRKLSESTDYSLVYQIYAPKVARYYNLYDTTVDYVYECYARYDKKFGVNARHSKVRWETLNYKKTGDGYAVTYIVDYSIDREDKTKTSHFVLEMHIGLDENYRITSAYEVQLDKY